MGNKNNYYGYQYDYYRIIQQQDYYVINNNIKCHVCNKKFNELFFTKDPKGQFWFCSNECYFLI